MYTRVHRHVYGHVCRHVYRNVSRHVCTDLCTDTCMGTSTDMWKDMCIDICSGINPEIHSKNKGAAVAMHMYRQVDQHVCIQVMARVVMARASVRVRVCACVGARECYTRQTAHRLALIQSRSLKMACVRTHVDSKNSHDYIGHNYSNTAGNAYTRVQRHVRTHAQTPVLQKLICCHN